MTRHSYFVPWAKTVAMGVAPGKGYMKHPSDEYMERLKKSPVLRKRWSEKAAVTKRAKRQKVSLATVPSLSGDSNESGNVSSTEAGVPSRSEIRRPQRGRHE